MTELARAEGIRSQSMAAIIAVLTSAGLIDRSPDPGDGRKIVLSVSAVAREQFETGRLAREDWLFRSIRSELSPAEQLQLASCVDLLKRLSLAP
jgi:DNA-binding MarR family transcriptional regulator